MADDLDEPQATYEKLWREAAAAFDRGNPRIDPFLNNRTDDPRRGVTLVARPNSEVRDRVNDFLKSIAEITPNQHFYQPAEFHLTVLAIIPGSELWQSPLQKLPAYLAALDEVLRNRPAFSVIFRGVTASSEAVMIQGFPVGNALPQLRNDLRVALARQGLGENLDRRYKIVTAHLTVMRFSKPMENWQTLKTHLATHRNMNFGETHVDSLQLIQSDWYASADTVRPLREYPLS